MTVAVEHYIISVGSHWLGFQPRARPLQPKLLKFWYQICNKGRRWAEPWVGPELGGAGRLKHRVCRRRLPQLCHPP